MPRTRALTFSEAMREIELGHSQVQQAREEEEQRVSEEMEVSPAVGFSLTPTLSSVRRLSLGRWLTRALESETLSTGGGDLVPMPTIWLYAPDETAWRVGFGGNWQESGSNTIYMAGESPLVPLERRFAYLMALVPLCKEHVSPDVIAKGIAKVMLGTYQGLTASLTTGAPVSKVAFNRTEGKVAGLQGDSYYTPLAEKVEVGDGWIVCEV